MLPKSVIYDLVYNVYIASNLDGDSADKSDRIELESQGLSGQPSGLVKSEFTHSERDDEEDDDDEESYSNKKKTVTDDTQDIAVIPDRGTKLLLIYSIGMLSISLPLIVHVIWRYTFNGQLGTTIGLIDDLSKLYTEAVALSWRPMGLYLHCTNEIFCDKYPANVAAFKRSTDSVSSRL